MALCNRANDIACKACVSLLQNILCASNLMIFVFMDCLDNKKPLFPEGFTLIFAGFIYRRGYSY